jgi:hypothetical protein
VKSKYAKTGLGALDISLGDIMIDIKSMAKIEREVA